MERTKGDGDGPGRRISMCVSLATACSSRRGDRVRSVVRAGLEEERLPAEFFVEVFVHLSLIMGFPTMLDGLEHVKHFASHEATLRHPATGGRRQSSGRKAFRGVYGRQSARVLRNLDRLLPGLSRWILGEAYGKVYGRKGLTLKEREILNVVVLAHQGLQKQLYSHLRGTLRSGMSVRHLNKCLLQSVHESGNRLSKARAMLRGLSRP